MDHFQDCDEDCLHDLTQIKHDFYTKELTALFHRQFDNPATNKIVAAIRENLLHQ